MNNNANKSSMEKFLKIMTILLAICLLGVFIPVAGSIAKTMTYRIPASADDTRCDSSDSLYSVETMYLPYSTTDRRAFWRWPMHVPQNAIIDSAYIKFRALDGSGNCDIQFNLVDSDNCPAFYPANPYNSSVTSNTVDWIFSDTWTDGGWYTSVDLKSLIQEYIGRQNYSYNNYIGIRSQVGPGGCATHQAYQFDRGAGYEPQLVVNYTGGDAIVEMWMAEPEVRTRQYIYVQVWNVDPVDRLVVTLDGREIYNQTFGAEYTEQHEIKILADYTGLAAGNHALRASVRSTGGLERGYATKTWKTLHTGYPKVGINENNAICIRNQDGNGCDLFFPLAPFIYGKEAWYPPLCLNWPGYCDPFAEVVSALNAEGYYDTHTPATWNDYLNKANEMGWRAYGPARWTGTIDDYLTVNKNHPALLGWMWGDEQDLHGYEDPIGAAQTLRNQLIEVHNSDTDHPVIINYYSYDFTRHPANKYPYSYSFNGHINLSDIMGQDYYPYEYAKQGATASPSVSLEDFLLNYDRGISFNYNLLPQIGYIETQDISDPNGVAHVSPCPGATPTPAEYWTPDPSAEQLKNMAWLVVIHGSKGIGYFGPALFCPTQAYETAVLLQFKKDITQFKDIILQATSPKANHTGEGGWWLPAAVSGNGRVDFTVRDYNGKIYIFAARVKKAIEGWPDPSNNQPLSTTFTLNGVTGVQQLSVFNEGRNVPMTNGVFSDSFRDYDVHIYIAEGGLPDTTPPAAPTGLAVQ